MKMGRSSCIFLLVVMTSLMTSLRVVSATDAMGQHLSPCEGANVTLSCNYNGSETNLIFTWTFSNSDGGSNGSSEIDLDTCSYNCDYTLHNVSSSDDGLYRCSVNGTVKSEYNVTIATPPMGDPVCSVSLNSTGGTEDGSTGVFYVREGDNFTIGCSVTGTSPWSLEWSYQDNGTSNSIDDVIGMNPMLTSELMGGADIDGRVFTCEATPNDTCGWPGKSCSVGPVFVITDENFYIRQGNGTVFVGDDVTFECVTNVTGTQTRWSGENGTQSLLVLQDVSTNINGSEFTCVLFAMTDPNVVIDSRETMIIVEVLPTVSVPPTTTSITPAGSTDSSTGTEDTPDTTAVRPTAKALNIAAIAGGSAGGAVLLLIIIVIIIVACKSKESGDEVDGGEAVKHRTKKTKKEGSKKHRSAILSLRHKMPLFSTPYADDDDIDEEKAGHNAPENTDVDTIIMEYRPQSKIASQIRVDLAVDDEDEGTVENGFVPVSLGGNPDEENPYSKGGVVEGRYGIIGQGTFADTVNENQDHKDDDGDGDDAPYTKVYKSNNPGDNSFDNMTYGPIEGLDDKTKASMYDGEGGVQSNGTDNADDVETPNGNVGDDVESGTAKKANIDRESAAYAEIPPPPVVDVLI